MDDQGDAAVRETAGDALVTKISAHKAGYFEDAYLPLLARRHAMHKSPLINRGTYARVRCMRGLLDRFLAAHEGKPTQVISIGCGMDTTYFHYRAAGRLADTLWVECDFEESTMHKARVVATKRPFLDVLGEAGRGAVHAAHGEIIAPGAGYLLLAQDLRDTVAVEARWKKEGMKSDVPTLVLSECVLVYMEPEESDALLALTARMFPAVSWAVYEMIQPNSAFGRMMLQNLHNRGCELRGLRKYGTLDAHKARFAGLGWTSVRAETMDAAWRSELVGAAEVQRVSRVEMLDEFEEWTLMQSHYMLLVASHSSGDASHDLTTLY